MRARCFAVAAAGTALVLLWLALTVRYNFGGNWTALFCTGANQRVPADLLAEKLYTFPASSGYDGQFYHYIAHDPLGRTQLPGYIDAPQLRYRRILVPALAYLAAVGQGRFIDAAYFTVVLGFVFLGCYWTSRFAVLHRRHPLGGFLFLAVPAVLISIDRMTVDVALAALCVGVAVFAAEGRGHPLLLLLIAAPLVRETGLAVPAAYCLWVLLRGERPRAIYGALTVVPFAAWCVYVQLHFGAQGFGWLPSPPLRDLAGVILHPYPSYPWGPAMNAIVLSADLLALAGSLAAIGLSFRFRLRRSGSLLEYMIVAFGVSGLALAVFGSRDVWVQTYGYARVLSALFVLLALRSLERRTWSDLAPVLLVLPRIGLHVLPQVVAVVRGLVAL
jgi:hypothetical protein